MATCSITTLSQQVCANGFNALSDGDLMTVLVQLLCNVSVSGGGGGLAGSGSPEGVAAASPGTTYLDTSSDSLWVKKTGTGSTGWIQLIA